MVKANIERNGRKVQRYDVKSLIDENWKITFACSRINPKKGITKLDPVEN
ncbi:hypothetical protein J6TS7_66490 [Paenibacillus dendritiformis]|nr:hypothetical protein J6TS7_66490 [Paenibacillus dendritiformis]